MINWADSYKMTAILLYWGRFFLPLAKHNFFLFRSFITHTCFITTASSSVFFVIVYIKFFIYSSFILHLVYLDFIFERLFCQIVRCFIKSRTIQGVICKQNAYLQSNAYNLHAGYIKREVFDSVSIFWKMLQLIRGVNQRLRKFLTHTSVLKMIP